MIHFPRALMRLVKLIREERPDIIQTWMYHADFLVGLAGRIAAHKRIVWGVRTTYVRSGGSRVTVLLRKICAWLSYYVPQTIVCARKPNPPLRGRQPCSQPNKPSTGKPSNRTCCTKPSGFC